jgi:protein-S-isoprenylcysteine O-methyltransferase Ste14
MSSKLEDLIGKTAIIVIFLSLAMVQFKSIVKTVQSADQIELWQIVLASRVAGLIFVALIVFLTVFRLPPKNVSTGLEPRLTSIAGTFCLMFLVVLPTGDPGLGLRALAGGLVVTGTVLSVWCAIHLGRSFSVMAVARQLVVHGPYSIVRHPLYAAEAVTTLGTVLTNWSVWACLLFVAWCALQYRRMLNEERILRATFPEYDDYANNVPMIVPWLTPYRAHSA